VEEYTWISLPTVFQPTICV